MKYKLLSFIGPTATGKTELALKLAKKFNGELVACDSRQVYQGLDIGTGKKPGGKWKMEDKGWKKGRGYWQINKIKIWMYDKVPLNKQYTVADYIKDAKKALEDITNRNKLPILVGGTGFYLDALLKGLPNLSIPVNKELRRQLSALSKKQLQDKLQEISPSGWKKLNSSDRQNPRRLLRSIELNLMYPRLPSPGGEATGGQAYIKKTQISKLKSQNWDILMIGLTAPREYLYEKINQRVFGWINEGIIKEVKDLLKNLSYERFIQLGLEYALIARFLNKEIKSEEELILLIQGKIRGYARRQETWFKKNKEINWFNVTTVDYKKRIEKRVVDWYNQQ